MLFPRLLARREADLYVEGVQIDSADPDGLHSFEKQSDLVATESCAVARRFQPIWTAGRPLHQEYRPATGRSDTTPTILPALQILASAVQPVYRINPSGSDHSCETRTREIAPGPF